jgi:hypothetical protein
MGGEKDVVILSTLMATRVQMRRNASSFYIRINSKNQQIRVNGFEFRAGGAPPLPRATARNGRGEDEVIPQTLPQPVFKRGGTHLLFTSA